MVDLKYIPFQDCINFGIAGWNSDDWTEEDLTVEDGMIKVGTLDWRKAKQKKLGMVPNLDGGAHTLEEVICCALPELLDWVFKDTEYDGLWAGKYHCG